MADVISKLAQNPPQDPAERRRLYDAARELMIKTEDKHVLTHRIFFSGIQLYLADIGVDLNIFATLTKDPNHSWNPTELAAHLGCDVLLLTRILRGLAAYDMIAVNTDGHYGSIPATQTLADPGVAGCIRNNVLSVFPALNALPQFLRETGHQNPTDSKTTAAQIGHHTDEIIWDWVASRPEHLKAAMINMQAQRADQHSWIDDDVLFPRECFQLSTDDSSRALLVDVGGGLGHQSMALRKAHPTLPGRVIVQDLPHTIAAADSESLNKLRIEGMGHDFFKPQPIKGAKVYYIRNVLHDYPDDRCQMILQQIRTVASEDSVLVIDEIVVRELGAQWQQVNYDLVMMSCLSAMERTLKQWQTILKATGFQLKEVREYDNNNGDSIIIAHPV